MFVCQVFDEFKVNFSDALTIENYRDGWKHTLFVFFILQKHNVLLLWVHTNKRRPLTYLNDVLLLSVWSKSME